MRKTARLNRYAFSIFTTLLIGSLTVSTVAYAADPRVLAPEVQEIIVKKTWYGEMSQNIKYAILKWLATVVDYISDAVDEVLDFNLYNVIKDVFDINSLIYPIAWALAGAMVALCGILIIVNADKIHLTDFVRNILTSIFFIVALPILVSSFADLKTTGIAFAKNNTTSDTATNRTIGQYLLASNIYNVNSSINKNSLVKQSQVQSFKDNPSTVYSININMGLGADKTQYRTVIQADHYDVTPTYRFDDLTFEHKLELTDLVDDYNYWQQRLTWYLSLSDSKRESMGDYKISVWHNGLQQDYFVNTQDAPRFTETFEYYIICEAAENTAHTLQDRGVTVGASQVAEMIMYCQSADSFEEAINRLSKGSFSELDFYGNKLSAMQILNVSNVEDFTDNGFEHHDGGSFEQLKEASDFSDGDLSSQFSKLWQYLSVGHLTETNHFYRVNFLWGLLMLIITAACLIFAGLKVATLLYDIMFVQIIAPLVVATDMTGSGRTKKVITNLLSCNLVMIFVVLDLRFYILILEKIQDIKALSNPISVIFLTLAGCKFVIDGPDLIVQLLGIDAGVKSGVATIMGIRSATQIAASVGHAASTVTRATAGAVGGAVNGGLRGAATAAQTGNHTATNVVHGAFGAVGGALAGGVSGAAVGGFGRNDNFAAAVSNGAQAGGAAGSAINHSLSDVARGIGNSITNQVTQTQTGTGETGGVDGRDGRDGVDGLNGDNGRDGESIQGEQGEQGEQGVNNNEAAPQGSFGTDTNTTNATENSQQSGSFADPTANNSVSGDTPTPTSSPSLAKTEYHSENSSSTYADTAMAQEQNSATYADTMMNESSSDEEGGN